MLRNEHTKTIADRIDNPIITTNIWFSNTHTNKNNYVDLFLSVINDINKIISLKFDIYGIYNYRNNTNFFSASVARINGFASSVCLSNAMVHKGLFISVPKYVDDNTIVVRIWCNNVESNSSLSFDTRIASGKYNGKLMFKLLRIESGYMKRNMFVPMIEGDSVHSWIVKDGDSIQDTDTYSDDTVNESNALNITWPTFNEKYKLVRHFGGTNYAVEYDKRAMLSLYISKLKSGTPYKLPLKLESYNAYITPVGGEYLTYTSARYTASTSDGTITIITGDGSDIQCDVLIYGYYRNPRFNKPNPNLVIYPDILDIPTEKKLLHNLHNINNYFTSYLYN